MSLSFLPSHLEFASEGYDGVIKLLGLELMLSMGLKRVRR